MMPTTPERHPHPPDPQPVRPDPAVDDLADRIGQRGDLAQPVGHRRRRARLSRSRSTTVAVGAALLGPGDVGGVGGEDLVAAAPPGGRRRRAGRRPWPRWSAGQQPRRRLGPLSRGRGSQSRSRPPAYDAGRAGTPPCARCRPGEGEPGIARRSPALRPAARQRRGRGRHAGVADHRPDPRRAARQRDRRALADSYNTANNVPNVIYELVLGGVLTATLVPLFTEQVLTRRRGHVGRRHRRRRSCWPCSRSWPRCGVARSSSGSTRSARRRRPTRRPSGRHDVLRVRLPAADLLLRRHRARLGDAETPGVGSSPRRGRRSSTTSS